MLTTTKTFFFTTDDRLKVMVIAHNDPLGDVNLKKKSIKLSSVKHSYFI